MSSNACNLGINNSNIYALDNSIVTILMKNTKIHLERFENTINISVYGRKRDLVYLLILGMRRHPRLLVLFETAVLRIIKPTKEERRIN